jgi:hypothetical protein
MKYRQTFREALNDVEKKDKPEVKSDEPTEDKDATIKRLQDEVAALKLKIETEKATAMKPEPNKDTGEVPLRTGVAAALLDKDGPSPKIVKDNKKKLKMSLGKSKVTIDPNVDIGQISGGIQTGTGNLH